MAIGPEDPMLLYNAGCIAVMLGKPEEALFYLEKASAAGLRRREWYENDGNLLAIKDHPRFKALLEKMG
jgi:adenylate cyclase